jgi:ribose transport system permease protein
MTTQIESQTTDPQQSNGSDQGRASSRRRSPRQFSALGRKYSLLLLWALMILALWGLTGRDPLSTITPVFSQQTPLILLGLGLVITMAVGEFDLSFVGIFSLDPPIR